MADTLREEVIRLHANICSGLADSNRIMIIYSLAEGPHNVSDIASIVELPQPTVSRHLKILRDRGIVRSERDGQTIIYSLSDKRIVQALDLLRATLGDLLTDQVELAKKANSDFTF
ncbi:MAG: metalloregulator ArsR/SmtB family transcription factor [Anaerolineaceae bacterium]|jgi:DNA-binding transcriptional ArsR family regulator|nr:metalloregulator ArsR/SmtB family transcription factor [Anaerolineaceae bacterium]